MITNDETTTSLLFSVEENETIGRFTEAVRCFIHIQKILTQNNITILQSNANRAVIHSVTRTTPSSFNTRRILLAENLWNTIEDDLKIKQEFAACKIKCSKQAWLLVFFRICLFLSTSLSLIIYTSSPRSQLYEIRSGNEADHNCQQKLHEAVSLLSVREEEFAKLQRRLSTSLESEKNYVSEVSYLRRECQQIRNVLKQLQESYGQGLSKPDKPADYPLEAYRTPTSKYLFICGIPEVRGQNLISTKNVEWLRDTHQRPSRIPSDYPRQVFAMICDSELPHLLEFSRRWLRMRPDAEMHILLWTPRLAEPFIPSTDNVSLYASFNTFRSINFWVTEFPTMLRDFWPEYADILLSDGLEMQNSVNHER